MVAGVLVISLLHGARSLMVGSVVADICTTGAPRASGPTPVCLVDATPAGPDDCGVSVRFKIVRVGATVARPAGHDARRRGCTCSRPENRDRAACEVSVDQQLRGCWSDEECVGHRTARSQG